MDTKMEHGLNFKTERIQGLGAFAIKSPSIRQIVKKYVAKTNDTDGIDYIMNQYNILVNSLDFYMRIYENDDEIVGILTGHTTKNHSITDAMIHIGYVDNTILSVKEANDIISHALNDLSQWAKSMGSKSIFIQSGRKDKSFAKFIKEYGWNRITTLYEKEIEHGKIQKNSTTSGRSVTA